MAHPAGLPKKFTCPLSGGVMIDPVRLETGVAFQRTVIANWFLECEPSTYAPCISAMHAVSNFFQTRAPREIHEETLYRDLGFQF